MRRIVQGIGSAKDWSLAHRLRIFSWGVFLFVLSSLAFSPAESPAKHGSVEHIKVHGRSLEGNLEGDSPDRDVSVYLPPSYSLDEHRRYPVVYMLHGFTDSDLRWFGNEYTLFNGAAAADRAFSSGTREMIVVMPNAYTRYFGSMYSSSVTTGDWEQFLARDLVTCVDSHYRTVANRMSRGIAGHSMGSYGAIRLAMKRPEVFSSTYALSACCLQPSPSIADSHKTKIEHIQNDEDLAKADFITKALFASAAAWSPNPQNAPRFLDLPWKDGVVQRSVLERWAANGPLIMLDQYVPSLKSLPAIAFDVGTHDFLADTIQILDRALTAYDIPHTFETSTATI